MNVNEDYLKSMATQYAHEEGVEYLRELEQLENFPMHSLDAKMFAALAHEKAAKSKTIRKRVLTWGAIAASLVAFVTTMFFFGGNNRDDSLRDAAAGGVAQPSLAAPAAPAPMATPAPPATAAPPAADEDIAYMEAEIQIFLPLPDDWQITYTTIGEINFFYFRLSRIGSPTTSVAVTIFEPSNNFLEGYFPDFASEDITILSDGRGSRTQFRLGEWYFSMISNEFDTSGILELANYWLKFPHLF